MNAIQFQQEKKEVLRLFDNYIFSYIIGDLDVLDQIQAPKYTYHCSIPTAMLILSALEFIGFLLGDESKTDDSEKNITYAMTYKDYFPDTVYTEEIRKILIKEFRHGMMHSFFPKFGVTGGAISLHKSKEDKLFEELELDNGTVARSMNVNVLSKDFRTFLTSLRQELVNTNENDTGPINNIYKSFKKDTSPTFIDYSKILFEPTSSFGTIKNKKT